MMSKTNARFQVVNDQWEEQQKQLLAFEEFFDRLNRLLNADERIERQSAQNAEAKMRLREEALHSLHGQDELIRKFLPDRSDPIIKLIDTAIDLLNQLHTISREHPAIHPDMQANLNNLVNALALPPLLCH